MATRDWYFAASDEDYLLSGRAKGEKADTFHQTIGSSPSEPSLPTFYDTKFKFKKVKLPSIKNNPTLNRLLKDI